MWIAKGPSNFGGRASASGHSEPKISRIYLGFASIAYARGNSPSTELGDDISLTSEDFLNGHTTLRLEIDNCSLRCHSHNCIRGRRKIASCGRRSRVGQCPLSAPPTPSLILPDAKPKIRAKRQWQTHELAHRASGLCTFMRRSGPARSSR